MFFGTLIFENFWNCRLDIRDYCACNARLLWSLAQENVFICSQCCLGDTAVILKVSSVNCISCEQEEGGERLHEAGRVSRCLGQGRSVCIQSRQRLHPQVSAGWCNATGDYKPISAASEHDCNTGRAQRTSPLIFNINIKVTDCRVYKYYSVSIYV